MKKVIAWIVVVGIGACVLGGLAKLLAERDAFGIAGAILLAAGACAAALGWAFNVIFKP